MAGLLVRVPAAALVPLAVSVLSISGSSGLAQAAFHAPQTEAERALEKILRRADKDERLLDISCRAGARGFKPSVNYENLLMPALIAAIRAQEKALVARDCKGKYLDGEICGLDYSPIACGQDSGERYEFRTREAEPRTASIDFRWPGGKTVATYRLVKADDA